MITFIGWSILSETICLLYEDKRHVNCAPFSYRVQHRGQIV